MKDGDNDDEDKEAVASKDYDYTAERGESSMGQAGRKSGNANVGARGKASDAEEEAEAETQSKKDASMTESPQKEKDEGDKAAAPTSSARKSTLTPNNPRSRKIVNRRSVTSLQSAPSVVSSVNNGSAPSCSPLDTSESNVDNSLTENTSISGSVLDSISAFLSFSDVNRSPAPPPRHNRSAGNISSSTPLPPAAAETASSPRGNFFSISASTSSWLNLVERLTPSEELFLRGRLMRLDSYYSFFRYSIVKGRRRLYFSVSLDLVGYWYVSRFI